MHLKIYRWLAVGILMLGGIYFVERVFIYKDHKVISLCTILPSRAQFEREGDTVPTWVAGKSLLWDVGATISIYFYDGNPKTQKLVLDLARSWARLGKLNFARANLPNKAEIRIAFRGCEGYYSLVGKQAMDPLYDGSPTMCLQGLDTLTDEVVFKRTVLHEFGHVMGLLHELQNPVASIHWDTPKLYEYYKKNYHWSPDSVDQWVLKQFTDSAHSRFDNLSIMLYAIPACLTKGGVPINWPDKLSKLDTQFVIQNYIR